VHAAVYDQELARRLLALPADRRCDVLVSFGHPAARGLLERPRHAVPRRPLGEIVHRERW